MNNVTFGDENVGYYETVAGGAGAVRVHQYTVSRFKISKFNLMLYFCSCCNRAINEMGLLITFDICLKTLLNEI